MRRVLLAVVVAASCLALGGACGGTSPTNDAGTGGGSGGGAMGGGTGGGAMGGGTGGGAQGGGTGGGAQGGGAGGGTGGGATGGGAGGGATGGGTGGGATGGGTGGGTTDAGTGGGGGSTDAGMPPTFNLTFAASCGAAPTCGGNVVGTWFFTAGCVEDSAFTALQSQCQPNSISNKAGTGSGSLTFTATQVTRNVAGSITFTMTTTNSLCVAGCANLPSLLAGYGITGTCTPTTTDCTCNFTTPLAASGTDAYTASGGTITITGTNTRTFGYCVTGTSMQYTETTATTREPGLYTLTQQ